MKQKSQPAQAVTVEESAYKRVLKWEEEPVLSLSIAHPKLPEDTPGLRRVGRYYRQVAEQWKARWEISLFAQARAAAEAARAASRPFRPWEAALTYHITFQEEGLLSLYTDAYEYAGGAHGLTVRRGDTWDLISGTPRSLRSFFPPGCRWRRLVLEEIARQIEARVATGESYFDSDWREKLAQEFDPERFYLTPEGPAVFYPLYAIAPYAEGIPVFQIPLPAEAEKDQKTPQKE